jgi:uncharacterized lipoprotein YmbA
MCVFWLLAALLGLALTGGCGGSKAARFYALSSMDEALAVQKTKTGLSDRVIGIGPIKIADYLDQPDIVTRDSENRLEMAEFDQWAGSFKDNLTNALTENIGFLMGTEQIYAHPWRRSVPIDYQVIIDVVRFDGQLGQDACLIARWSLFGGKPRNLVDARRSSVRVPVEGGTYEDLVAAQSLALAQLSREIAEAIRSVMQ